MKTLLERFQNFLEAILDQKLSSRDWLAYTANLHEGIKSLEEEHKRMRAEIVRLYMENDKLRRENGPAIPPLQFDAGWMCDIRIDEHVFHWRLRELRWACRYRGSYNDKTGAVLTKRALRATYKDLCKLIRHDFLQSLIANRIEIRGE